MMKKSLAVLASVMVLGSCTSFPDLFSGQTTSQPPILRAQNTLSRNPEQAVEVAELQRYLSTFAGKTPLPDGSMIGERGSVNGRAQTRKFILGQLKEWGYQPELHNYRKNGDNVIVHLKATEPTSEYILLGAHMDSVSNAGADDNASGSSAVLEAARILRNQQVRKANIMFAWFDEEELGLIGSYALAKDLKKQGLNLTSVHTADMVGWDSDKDNAVEIEQPDGPLWAYYQMVNNTHKLNLKLVRTSSGDTDHVAFRRTGFQSVGLCEEWVGGDTTPYYHRKTDVFDSINFTFLANNARLMIAVASDLLLKVPPPANIQLVPHEQFPGRPRPFHRDYQTAGLDGHHH